LCDKLKQFQKPDWQREPANNLKRIAEQGLEQWKREQKARWSCKQCGALFSDKDNKCRKCGKPV
jgi:rubrerythrin